MRRTISTLSTISVVALASLTPAGEASAAIGGPDAFGYTYFDQVDGAVYNYVNITATGVQFQAFGDDFLGALTLAAPFTFYGVPFTDLDVSTNGFITLAAATGSDLTNSCPLPDPTDAVNPRIAFLHDDLETRIFYQYFDQAAAAAVGYPGETGGMSVIQWTGDHFPDALPDNLDFEAILFHASGEILLMVASDPETGSGSTTGIHDPISVSALTYGCNLAGSLTPGATAVRFVPPEPVLPPDSDCCTASPTGAAGCLDAACETTVCAADAFCCDTEWDDICADEAGMLCGALCGVCGDGVLGGTEECDTAGESAMCDLDCTFASCGDTTINAAAGETCDDGAETATCDDDCTAVECGDATVNTTAGETCDDGGRSPECNADCTAVSCGDGVTNAAAGEECDDAGESATCDPDCTNAMCGDGALNVTAGEECDDAGESKGCDDDCTASACGDGVTNATAGEECDDGNTDDGDGCAADCTEEPEPGTTGDESSGGEPTTGPGDDTAGDSTSGGAVDDTAGSSGAEPTTGPGPVTLDGGNDSSGGGETDTDTTAGETPLPEGCGCSTDGPDTGRGALWSVLAFFGLGALRRRRRRA